jgi:subtilisin family serine protease
MKHTWRSIATFALLVCLLQFLSSQVQSQPIASNSSQDRVSISSDEHPSDSRLAPELRTQRSGIVKVVVELSDEPSVVTYAATRKTAAAIHAGREAQAQTARIEQAQQQLLTPLRQLQAEVIYRVQRVYNGIGVRVDASKLAAIAALPGVKAIHPLVTKYVQNSGSVPMIGAPKVWEQTVGANKATGKGIKIAIIDSGIDYIHKDFGGSGNYTGVTDTSAPAFTAKVVGGYDFVGDNYDAGNIDPAKRIPHPDANPMDCLGHGTSVAGTAAGFGVNADGSTYTGPWTQATPFSTMKIGPGVAPEATLYALRVFGCTGTTDVADQALDWAVDPNGDGNPADHVDVINMSLGSRYGSTYDSSVIASENAAKAGVILVASAGNEGDTQYILGSPASADSVISVAAAGQPVQPTSVLDGILVTTGSMAGALLPVKFSAAFATGGAKPDVTGAVYYPDSNRTGCDTYSPAEAAKIAGKVVIVDRTDACDSYILNVRAAGAIGAIVVDDRDVFDLSPIFGSRFIPVVTMPKNVGDMVKANLANLSVRFSQSFQNSTTYQDSDLSDVVAGFSSRGPRRGGMLKPDITAPGINIFSARAGTGSDGQFESGTSLAAPHVAGTMAILKQIHPTWTVQQLKALVMNTATNDVRIAVAQDSQILGPARVGAGRVNVPNAATASVIAFDSARPSNVSVSFGNVEVASITSLTRTVTVANKGAATATYDLSYTPATTIPGVTYSISPGSVTVNPGQSATVTVVMSTDPSKMKHVIDSTEARTLGGVPRQFVSDASGYLTMTPPTAKRSFTANIRSYYENPPTAGAIHATAILTYTQSAGTLDYTLAFSAPYTVAAGHIHSGLAGANGAVLKTLTGAASNLTKLGGTVALSASEVDQLINGGLYINFHTAAKPAGEIRGQIVPTNPALRLPIYASARLASAMKANITLKLPSVSAAKTNGTIALSGIGVNTGTSLPTDTLSLVTAFELQYRSPALVATNALTNYTDLQYVGVNSTYSVAKPVEQSQIVFGISTYGNWTWPTQPYFEVDIDTNRDGQYDYALFTRGSNDVFMTSLVRLMSDGSIDPFFGGGAGFVDQYPLNVLDASKADTNIFNTNVIVLAVNAADMGLTATANSFDYRVSSEPDSTNFFEQAGNRLSDATPVLHYTLTKPGITFGSGLFGLPAYADLPDTSISFTYDRENFHANGSQGFLLLHHHNVTGARGETFRVTELFVPLIRK